jgi:hypothetical protein
MFLLFAGDSYYPDGGADDFLGAFPTVAAAKHAFRPGSSTWAHIVTWDGQLFAKVSETTFRRERDPDTLLWKFHNDWVDASTSD